MTAPISPYQPRLDQIATRRGEVTLEGARTAYWEYGDPDAAVTMVFVHGFRGDHHGLEPIVAQFPDAHIIAPDLPGFGESAAFISGRHDIEGYVRWLQGFIAALDLAAPPVILGHSFGSIVVSAAVADGQPVSTLILVNPIAAPALSGPRGILTRLAVFYYWAGKSLPEGMGFALLRSRIITRVSSIAMAKTKDPERRAWIHDQHDRYFSAFADRASVMDAFDTSVRYDVSQYADRIPVRTLLIAAENDDITSVPKQRELAEKLADARLEIIPEVGHLIHYETPEQAAALIRDELGLPA
ncbi:pimeloyl-ACP methyl ester carboxylesterase [Mycetocola sp. BIGb0189]|uniref:alpha/beta fold hydrolase n=1 Tax=Mycetocola sp. BIGb0189 TaxID=2940604 RepID=UPI002166D969|nr:alpha/beta hydrolase [Mycetocola sp. BIGb0189]MCS4277039.1 pimeloyl-ACP methyl ester carboxylesterase [Mycetocola sp. BIGb0189]